MTFLPFDNLRQARQLLQRQVDRYPNANTHNDALTLAARLDGELARRGDADAARDIAQELQNQDCVEGENDVRIAALNALMNSNPERALPILKRVLERRDPCSAEMCKTALFVISQLAMVALALLPKDRWLSFRAGGS